MTTTDDTEAARQPIKDWADLTPDEAERALAAVETLRKISEVLPTLSEEQKQAVRIQQEADRQTILKQGRRKAEAKEAVEIFHESRKTANSGPVDLRALLETPPAGYEPRVWDPVSKQVLMRKGQIGSLAGPDKGGKTRIAVSLMAAMLDPTGGTPFLRYYTVEPLRDDQVVVHIALEEDDADMFAAWGPYLRGNPEMADRVISISYSGVNVNMTASEIRDEVGQDIFNELFKREEAAGRELHIGAVVIDPLFAMAQGDYNKDPRLATEVFNNVLKTWCKDQLGAEVVLVLAHTSREGGRMGSEGSIYGSIGWASKMHFLWYVLKDQKQDDYRIFGANRGRADTYAFPQRLYMLSEEAGDDPELWGQVEVRPEEGDEAAKERASGKTTVDSPKKMSKMMGLRVWVMDRLTTLKSEGKTTTHGDLMDELRKAEALLAGAGKDVPFASSGSSLSKVLTALEGEGLAAVERDKVDPKIKHISWSAAVDGDSSLMPPVREVRGSAVVVDGTLINSETGEILAVPGTDGEPGSSPEKSSVAPPSAPEIG